jgi:hypothetical protein
MCDNTNGSKDKLTIEKLRQFEGMENLTEAESLFVINTLEMFASFTYNILRSQSNENE